MLAGSEMPLPAEVAKELRDALGRRQKELPPRWLAAHDGATLRHTDDLPGRSFDDVERTLGLTLVDTALAGALPRALVCVQPSASRATHSIASALGAHGSVTAVAAAELEARLAGGLVARLAAAGSAQVGVPLVCDCTTALPLPDRFPRPRVYLCLGNVIGSTTTVGTVRMLRVLRTTMTAGDALIVGLDIRPDASGSELDFADRDMGAFALMGARTGAAVDRGGFEYRRLFDADSNRHESHLVARRVTKLEVPGVCTVRFRKGESIRTSVSGVFDRSRTIAMMSGVGLTLREWLTDESARFAVALATPAV